MVERAFGDARHRKNFRQADADKAFVGNQALAAVEDVVFGSGLFGKHSVIMLKIDRSSSDC